eukprot:COSAG01_NODE_69434_length_261_cov_0.932099_1_plen_46_part_01
MSVCLVVTRSRYVAREVMQSELTYSLALCELVDKYLKPVGRALGCL